MYIPDFLIGYFVGAAVECVAVISVVVISELGAKNGKRKRCKRG